MKFTKRVLGLLLMLAIFLTAAGCDTEVPVPSSTAAPTTVPTTAAPTTEPAPDVAAIYADALSPMLEATEIAVVQTTDFSVTVQGETFHSVENMTTNWKGLGTEEITASAEGNVDYDGETAKVIEVFKDGTVYSTLSYYLGDFKFTSEMDAETFQNRFLPLAMLDAALYEELTLEESASGNTIFFRQPTGVEAWLGLPEEAVLVSAEGSAVLTLNGKLTDVQYTVTYEIAGLPYTVIHTQKFYSTVTVKDAPSATESYVPIGHPDVPKWFVRLDGHLLQAQNFSSHTAKLTLSAAAGYSLVHTTDLNAWGSGKSYLAKAEQDITANDYTSGTEEKMNFVEKFVDGKYTSITDGGNPERNSQVTVSNMTDYMVQTLVENTLYIYDLASAELTDLGGSILIEFKMSDDFESNLRAYLNEYLFNDEAYLDDLATSYTVDTLEGYLAFDKYSGLPTAAGYKYEGTHTIYGQTYVLSEQLDQSFLLASPDAYFAITEEFTADEAPETEPTPLFYKVTGSNGQTMWLLGTIHVGDNRTAHLPQMIYDAFNSADALAVECDVDAFDEQMEEDEALQELVSDAYFYSDGSTTKDHIQDEELYTYALRMMKASGNYNFNGLYFKPSVWSSSLDNFYLQQGYQLLSDKGVDSRLLKMAKAMDKPVYEVESNEFQIGMLNGWSEELQEYLLLENCSYDYPAYCVSVMELYEAWLGGNEAELIEMLSDEVDTSEMTEEELAEYEKYKDLLDEYNNAMGPDRNDDMLNVAIQYLESGETVFYAVGLAHLLAPDGLVFTLRDAGYTVELVSGTPAN